MTNTTRTLILLAATLTAGGVQAQRGREPSYTKRGTAFKVSDTYAESITRLERSGAVRYGDPYQDWNAKWRGVTLTAIKITSGRRTGRGVEVYLRAGSPKYDPDLKLSTLEVSELNTVRQKFARLVKVTEKKGYWTFNTENGITFLTLDGEAQISIGRSSIILGSYLSEMTQALQKSHIEARNL